MTSGATANPIGADTQLRLRRHGFVLFAAIAVLWTALSWFVVERVVRDRTAALVARETAQAREDVSSISQNFERVLNRLQGLPAVLAAGSDVTTVLASFGPSISASQLSRDARLSEWTTRSDLATLNTQLLGVAREMDVDIVWVMNASGDCVASGNFQDATSFIGTNYADRSYFRSAVAGQRGRQYAMGRVTNVPGLFFSAPVTVNRQFLGVVSIKIDLPRLAPWLNHPNAFVTDEYGVIVLSADRRLEMRALPGATVRQLPAEQRQARYKRENFETLGLETQSGPEGLVRLAGSPHPHAAAHSERPQHGIAVHIVAPILDIQTTRSDAVAAFLLLSFSGIALTALVFGARAYFRRARQHRESIEATNESLNKLNEHLDRLARIDSLTGAANRRHFQTCLDAELLRAGRYGRECSLVSVDIDHFKQINDRNGHAAGDEALRHFVQVTNRQLRGQDVLGRMGGEEFAVVLPETGIERAIAAAERIRHAVEATPARFGDTVIPMTASFGVACWKSPDESADALLQRTDAALYAAKSGGRNRVVADEIATAWVRPATAG
jgi:two-component system, NtrC family, C4-dicarboxylate transport sensor histidine kinase DctB